jgi:acetolactate synthase regulatory subunit
MMTLQIDEEPEVLRRVARVLRNLGQWEAAARASGALAARFSGSLAPLLQHLKDLECAGQCDRQRSTTEAIFGQAQSGPDALGRSAHILRRRGFHAAAAGISGIQARVGLPSLSGFLVYLKDLHTARLPIWDDAVSRECLSRAETRRLLSPSLLDQLEKHGLLLDFARLLIALFFLFFFFLWLVFFYLFFELFWLFWAWGSAGRTVIL